MSIACCPHTTLSRMRPSSIWVVHTLARWSLQIPLANEILGLGWSGDKHSAMG